MVISWKELRVLLQKKNFKNVELFKEVSQKKYLSILNEADIGLVLLNSNLKSNNFSSQNGWLVFNRENLSWQASIEETK